jgi:hypothetical protein
LSGDAEIWIALSTPDDPYLGILDYGRYGSLLRLALGLPEQFPQFFLDFDAFALFHSLVLSFSSGVAGRPAREPVGFDLSDAGHEPRKPIPCRDSVFRSTVALRPFLGCRRGVPIGFAMLSSSG